MSTSRSGARNAERDCDTRRQATLRDQRGRTTEAPIATIGMDGIAIRARSLRPFTGSHGVGTQMRAAAGHDCTVTRHGDRPRRLAVRCAFALFIGLLAGAVGACSTECVQDGPPFIQFDDRNYTADLAAPAVPDSQIGTVVFTVANDRSAASSACGGSPVEGDSSLPIGTEFHSINGIDPAEGLAATFEGRFIRFSA